jgi:hypothetical protein
MDEFKSSVLKTKDIQQWLNLQTKKVGYFAYKRFQVFNIYFFSVQ